MDIRTRLIGPCASRLVNRDGQPLNDVALDLGAFLRRILLFEKYILESMNLWELPHLLRHLGWEGLNAVVESGALRFHCDALNIVSARSDANHPPPNAYAFGL